MTKREFKLGENGKLFIEPSFETLPLQPDEAPLVLSIQKWQAIVAHLSDGRMVTECGDWSTCALCQEHFDEHAAHREFCNHCPIYEHTAPAWGCDATPYKDWAILPPCPDSIRVRLIVAQQEVEFLKSLREEQ